MRSDGAVLVVASCSAHAWFRSGGAFSRKALSAMLDARGDVAEIGPFAIVAARHATAAERKLFQTHMEQDEP